MNNNLTLEDLEKFASKYHSSLTTEARDYLHNRGISDDSINRFKLGFGSLYGTTWITIPVYDDSGRIHYIKLRHFPENAPCEYDKPVIGKYSNYPSGCETILFNEGSIKDANDVLIVEGEFDAIIASQNGLPPAVAVPAADVFKAEWAEKLKHARTICVWLDNDSVGQRGQEELIDKLTKLCPDSTILSGPSVDGVKDATEFFTAGYSEQEFRREAKYVAGPPLFKDNDLEEMSLDDLADILDTTIKYDRQNKCILFLAMLSAYTEQDQLNVCLLGQSSSGKTYLAQEVAKYFPDEDVKEYAEVSPTAFKHMNPVTDEKTNQTYVDCERKIMMFTEMPHPTLLTNLRPLLSHDKKEIEFLTTDKNGSGSNVAKRSVIRGFPTVVFCSAYTKLDEQEITRCLLLSPETGSKKVEAGVSLASQKLANLAKYNAEMQIDPKRQSLKNRIRYIKSLGIESVIINTPEKVLERFRATIPDDMPPHCQRDIAHVFSLIKAVAMLNAHNRMDKDKNIVVSDQDIDTGFNLWETISKTQNLGVPPAVYDFYEKYIVPPYLCIKESQKASGTLPTDDGITLQDILAYYYEVTGSSYNADVLRKQIIPPLQTANMVQVSKSINDARRSIIKPLYSVK